MDIIDSGAVPTPEEVEKLSEFVEIRITIRRKQFEMFQATQQECGLDKPSDVFQNAMSLFIWAMNRVKEGKRIASYDEAADEIEVVSIPAFDYLPVTVPPKDFFADVSPVSPWWKRLFGGV